MPPPGRALRRSSGKRSDGRLTAFCAGFPAFNADGTVVGSLDCEITGGTGRFDGASGSYLFFLNASPLPDGSGFATEAELVGAISF